MSKASGVNDAAKCDQLRISRKHIETSKSTKGSPGRKENPGSPKRSDIKSSTSDAQRVISPRPRHDITLSAPSQRKKSDSLQFSISGQSKDGSATSPTRIPYYKIVAGKLLLYNK